MAVEYGIVQMVKLLLDNKNIDIKAPKIVQSRAEYIENTPLHRAIQKGDNEITKLLLNHKDIDINKHHIEIDSGVDREEKTALHFAVKLGNAGIVKFLLEKSELEVNLYKEHINVIDLGGGFGEVDMFFKKKRI